MDGHKTAEGIGPRADSLFDGGIVAVSGKDTEMDVVGKERWEQIRHLSQNGQSIAAIARHLEMDRKTVRRCLRQSDWVPYQREAKSDTLLAEHMTWLIERAPQVRYSARILFQELTGSRGYQGGYDTVKLAVRPLRSISAATSLTQNRFETLPGQQAQVDWGEVKVYFGDLRVRVHIFVMTLGYSRRAYVEGFEHERQENLLAAHERAFSHFGGRCAEILYDRMRTVVQRTDSGKPRWNPTFEAFAKHWGFEPRLCRAYRAQTKGKVESGVKYVKRNFVPGRTFVDLVDFNEQLRLWTQDISDLRIHGTTHQRPIDRFMAEAASLVPTAGHSSFMQAMVRERVVAEDWLVSIDANRYSVPFQLIGKTVQVVRAGAHWQIRFQGQIVAEHIVLAGRHELSVKPEHSPGAAERHKIRRGDIASGHNRTQSTLIEVEIRDLNVYDAMLEVA